MTEQSASESRSVISQEKGLLIAEAFAGCPLGCGYCFRAEKDETVPRRVIGDEELVESLLTHKYFLRNKSPLSVNCNYTDPFLPQTKQSTFRILEFLEAEGIRNLVSLITKTSLPDEDIAHLERFRNLDLEVCVSYSEMPDRIEPVSNKSRVDFLYRLGQSNLRTLHFYRPMAIGWNSSIEHIRKVLMVARDAGVDVVMVGGLLLSNSIRNLIQQRCGLPPPEYKTEDKKKYLPAYIKQTLLEIYQELGLLMPMVRRTSCGRSVIRSIPDYNGHWAEPERNCWSTCPKTQQQICATKKRPTEDEVRYLLDKIDKVDVRFDINPDKTVTFYTKFTRRETNFIRSNLGVMIKGASEYKG